MVVLRLINLKYTLIYKFLVLKSERLHLSVCRVLLFFKIFRPRLLCGFSQPQGWRFYCQIFTCSPYDAVSVFFYFPIKQLHGWQIYNRVERKQFKNFSLFFQYNNKV